VNLDHLNHAYGHSRDVSASIRGGDDDVTGGTSESYRRYSSVQADNRLQSYTLTQGAAVLTVTLTYNSDGRVATITLAGPAGDVIVTPTYTSGNITAMTVSVV
jgi:YD repeat-containing protein